METKRWPDFTVDVWETEGCTQIRCATLIRYEREGVWFSQYVIRRLNVPIGSADFAAVASCIREVVDDAVKAIALGVISDSVFNYVTGSGARLVWVDGLQIAEELRLKALSYGVGNVILLLESKIEIQHWMDARKIVADTRVRQTQEIEAAIAITREA